MVRVISKILSILIILSGIGFTGYNIIQNSLTVMPLNKIPTDYVETNYVGLEDNMGKTTINGIGNIYVNMISEGFYVQQEAIAGDSIDVVFTNGEEVRRYNYDKNTQILTYLFNPYERTVDGGSYITGRDV